MGLYTLGKYVLFDERECGFEDLAETVDRATFAEIAEDIATEQWMHCEDFPIIDVRRIVSERFGQVFLRGEETHTDLCMSDWQSSLHAIAQAFGGLETRQMGLFLANQDVATLTGIVTAQLHDCIDTGHLFQARKLITTLEHLETCGLPGFEPGFPSIGGDDEACDARSVNHGAGRRWIVEYTVAFA